MAKKIPLRQCVGCGEMKGKKDMMRVLKTTEEEICLDVTGKKNGRGAYLCADSECLKKAEKSILRMKNISAPMRSLIIPDSYRQKTNHS